MPNEFVIISQNQKDQISCTIKIAGEVLSATFQVLTVGVHHELNRISSAQLTILDGDPAAETFAASDTDFFLPGKEIEILAGYHGKTEPIFKGIIIKHSVKIRKNASFLLVDCRDKAIKMTLSSKSQYFLEKKDSEIIEEIAKKNGLQTIISPSSVQHESVTQIQLSDWDFIVNRANRLGHFTWTNGGKLVVFQPDFAQPSKIDLRYGDTILEFEAAIDARDQPKTLKSADWNQANQAWESTEAAEPNGLPTAGNLTPNQLAASLDDSENILSASGQSNPSDAQKTANAKLLWHRMAKIRGSVAFPGLANVVPGNLLGLKGVGKRFEGKVFISGIRHRIADGDWVCHAQFGISPAWFLENTDDCRTNRAGILSNINGLHIGIVTAIGQDPADEHRIRVKLPLVNPTEEGSWARVATFDAGDNRGAFFRPELQDEVVVGFFDNNPNLPVVLGCLHSSAKPAPLAGSDDNFQKGYFSKSALKWTMDDDKKIMQFSSPAGNKITLSDDQKGILVEDQNGHKITLNDQGILLESASDLTLKAAQKLKISALEVEIDAQTTFSAKANASAEIKSSGSLTIKGAMVLIN